MKVYKTINNEIVLTNNERTDCGNPICDRSFTTDEQLWHSRGCLKIQGNDVVIDQVKKDQYLSKAIIDKRNQLILELRNKIDNEIENALSKYPMIERLSFAPKTDEAEKLTANLIVENEAKLIFNECKARLGGTIPTLEQCKTLSNQIISNANSYKITVANATAIRAYYEAIINDPLTDILNYSLPNNILGL